MQGRHRKTEDARTYPTTPRAVERELHGKKSRQAKCQLGASDKTRHASSATSLGLAAISNRLLPADLEEPLYRQPARTLSANASVSGLRPPQLLRFYLTEANYVAVPATAPTYLGIIPSNEPFVKKTTSRGRVPLERERSTNLSNKTAFVGALCASTPSDNKC